MWKQLYQMVKTVLSLSRQTEQNTGAIKELQLAMRELSEAVRDLSSEVRELNLKVEFQEKQATAEREHFARELQSEREKFRLQLENLLLRYRDRLPPPEEDVEE
jgi:methyl-accepting chemotaxis protein